ncbi:hypothetical protein PENTCL1PPCAC_6994 [Pristionchus entomophagus]|uniref:Uncharacterized protein n=1 Tax=Pristionchus entomophagus TaxID=358040 RepID=A0AAV5SX42_9BILA|nr:hypothetical protein PENTCL1PPCAC_6994 [Pristionchus entomophagus]
MVSEERRRLLRRILRIICGKRLPQTWNTVLVLLSIHMYLTVPIIMAMDIRTELRGLLRPYREIQARGILVGEIDEDLLDLFYED